MSSLPWYNLARQEIQPLNQEIYVVQANLEVNHDGISCESVRLSLWVLTASICDAPAFSGGQVLRISGAQLSA